MRETNFLIENNARHLWHPMAHPAEMQATPPRIINAGEGVEIVDIHGKKVLDGVGGLWNVNLGYSCEPVKEAIRRQLDELPYYSTFRGTTNSPLIELSYELAEWFREDGLTRSFFTSGGSDSVETCLRLARQYHKLNGQPERTKFVALKRLSWHPFRRRLGQRQRQFPSQLRAAASGRLPSAGTLHLSQPLRHDRWCRHRQGDRTAVRR